MLEQPADHPVDQSPQQPGRLKPRQLLLLERLADIEGGSGAAVVAQFHQLQAVLGGGQRLAADLQFEILFEQLEVGVHDVGNQRDANRPPAFHAGQVISARRFRKTAQTAPDIQLPTDAETGLRLADGRRKAGR